MINIEQAEYVLQLNSQRKKLKEQLNEIEYARHNAKSISVSFSVFDEYSGYDRQGLTNRNTFGRGNLNAVATAVLGRMSDEASYQIRRIEHELRELGVTP